MAESANNIPASSGNPPWSQVWQVPVLVLGVVLLGVWFGMRVHSNKRVDDFPGALDSASQYLQAREFEKAREKINELLPHVTRMSPADEGRLRMLWGDLLLLTQHDHGGNLAQTNQDILQLYKRSRELGQVFDTQHLRWLASTHVLVGQEAEALKIVDELKAQPAETRLGLLREIIDRRRSLPEKNADSRGLLTLLQRFEDELRTEPVAAKRRPDEIWAIGLRAKMLIESNAPDRAVDLLQRQMITLMDQAGDRDLAPLMVLLASAFQRTNENAKAQKWFLQAQNRLSKDDPLNAEVLVGLGQIDIAQSGDYREALAKFSQAESQYATKDSSVYFDALLGRADCEAHMGAHNEAIEHFVNAGKYIAETPARAAERTESLVEVVRSHFTLLSDHDDFDQALSYLSILTPLYKSEKEWPPRLIYDFAVTHERIGQKRLLEARSMPSDAAPGEPEGGPVVAQADAHGQESPASASGHGAAGSHEPPATAANKKMSIGDADHAPAPEAAVAEKHDAPAHGETPAPPPAKIQPAPSARKLAYQQASLSLTRAADYYRRHAHAIAAADDEAQGSSLWKSAECFDLAQRWPDAISVYAEFVKTRPGDRRQLQAMNRLGLSYKADAQFRAAADMFRRLIEEHPTSPEAYASHVPLAQCESSLGHDDVAKRLLKHVVTNHPAITPDSPLYKDALIELAKLHYQLEEFEPAIERLEVAVERYKESPEAASLRFRLADAYRRSVQQINKTLEEPAPQSRKIALQAERSRRLEAAQVAYSQVIAEFESHSRSTLSPVETLFLRNAYFYRGDCAFDLGRYETAKDLYDLAAKRWENHPSSLVALVQIFNSYCKLGRVQEAAVANRRAKAFLQRLPESAFDDPSLPMSRAHWEEWLKWTNELNLAGRQTTSAEK